MYAAVIIGLAVLLIPGGHCRPRATSSPFQGAVEVAQFLTTSTVHKRQNIRIGTCDTNQLQNIFANYPRDCVSSLTNLDLTGILNLNPTALTEAYRIICQPRCGNPIVTFYSQCGLSQLTGILRGFCSRNADGTFCYEDFVRVLYTRRKSSGVKLQLVFIHYLLNGLSECLEHLCDQQWMLHQRAKQHGF